MNFERSPNTVSGQIFDDVVYFDCVVTGFPIKLRCEKPSLFIMDNLDVTFDMLVLLIENRNATLE